MKGINFSEESNSIIEFCTILKTIWIMNSEKMFVEIEVFFITHSWQSVTN